MPSTVRALIDYDIDLLEVIASQWDIDLAAADRVEMVGELAAAMTRPEAVLDTWNRLDEPQQQALYDLLANDGRRALSHFVRVYGEIRPMGPARREREKPWVNPASVTESLFYRGLITRTFEQTASGMQEYIAIPADLRPLMPQPDLTVSNTAPGYPVAPPRKLKDGHITTPDDVATILAYLMIRETNAREWLENRPVEQIDPYLRRPDEPAYRALLVQLAYDLSLIKDVEVLTHITTQVNREVARPWLEAPRLHQARSLVETWLASGHWNDLAYVPGLEADQWPNVALATRVSVMEMLQDVPAEMWWSLDGFIDHIHQNNPDFQRTGGDYNSWYIRDAYTGELLPGFQYWEYIDGALLRFTIDKVMNWLGLVLAGRGAFYLTPLGLALLDRAAWPSTEDPEARVRVDEQGMITVPVAVERYARLQIARFASWISSPPPSPYTTATRSKDEGCYVYRLTSQAVERARAAGISLSSHIISFLQKQSGQSLPPNIVAMLEGWEKSPRDVVVHDVVLVTAKDLGVYEELRSNPRIKRWLGQQIGPHAHVVKREHMPALFNALREMGILPVFEGHDKDDRPA
nr:helicase-associated domain-containing protein [Anaerolineae bacterium]